MATIEWRGDTPAVAQVDSFTPSGTIVGSSFTVTINGKDISYTTSVGTEADVCSSLKSLLEDSNIPEFREVIWTNDATAIYGTARTPGQPFTASCSSSATFTQSTDVDSTGPNHVDEPKNYSTGSIPTAGDTLIVRNDVDLLYGLDQSAAGTWANIIWYPQARARLGLPEWSNDGYRQYRDTHLKVNVSAVVVGGYSISGTGQGTDRFKINCLATQVGMAVRSVLNPDSNANGEPAVSFIGSNSSNVFSIDRGSAWVGILGTANVATLAVGSNHQQPLQANDPLNPMVESEASITTAYVAAYGTAVIKKNPTTLTVAEFGKVILETLAAGALTTCTIARNAVVLYKSGQTITTLNCAGVFENQGGVARTITNCNLYAGFDVRDPARRCTFTNGLVTVGCALTDGKINVGQGRTYTVT